MRVVVLLAILLLGTATARAHEILHEVERGEAAVVHLRYGDGTAFAYESYELTPEGAQLPSQLGRTDAQGRVVFLPGASPRWRLKAWTEDGHGVDLQLTVDARGELRARGQPLYERATRLVVGLATILGLFGALMFWQRKKDAR